jgi:hypothetical protein
MRPWANWDEDRPGFVEIDTGGPRGGDTNGDFAYSLTVTDIATGWTEVPQGGQQGRQARAPTPELQVTTKELVEVAHIDSCSRPRAIR